MKKRTGKIIRRKQEKRRKQQKKRKKSKVGEGKEDKIKER